MNLDQLLKKYERRFADCGELYLPRGESIGKKYYYSKIPNEWGVYLIYGIKKRKARELLNIGKSGTFTADKKFMKQTLRSRLTKGKQQGIYRPTFFIEQMDSNKCVLLKISWFVTIDKKANTLPAFAEAELLQAYYSEKKRLPEWNKEF